jgi:hypothetical protein
VSALSSLLYGRPMGVVIEVRDSGAEQLRRPHGLRLLGLLFALVGTTAGCGGGGFGDNVRDGLGAPSTGPTVPTTAGEPVPPVPAEEQETFEQMYDAAMKDGAISVSELELFAVEAVRCMNRAGLDARLGDVDPENGSLSFSVAADGPDDMSGQSQADGCFEGFYNTPWEQFKRQG